MKNNLSIVSRMLVAFASGAVLCVYFLPAWRIDLFAPQYPEGLTMKIWINDITGDVDVINGLNHYIGMKSISVDMFPEFKFLPYVVAVFVILGLAIAFSGKRRFLFAYLVLTAIGGAAALYDFYRWGYDYGHNLDPKAPIQVPGLSYQPPLFGHKRLLNFDAYSYPDVAGWIVIGAGTLAFAVWFVEWFRVYREKRSARLKPAIPVIAAILLMTVAGCSTKPEPFKLGEDNCSYCRMTITDPHFGGETVTKKGKVYKFDDLHCMLAFLDAKTITETEISQNLVINYARPNSFLEAGKAVFFVSDQLKSPMGSNAGAFETKEPAQQLKVKGRFSDWQNLNDSIRKSGETTEINKSLEAPVSMGSFTIKQAIENARPGDTVYIKKGVYKEGNIVLTRPVTLIGEDYPVIDGENKYETLTISGHDIKVSGIEFRNVGQSSMNDYAAIKLIDSRNVIIEKNKINNAYFGIHLSNTTTCTVRDNLIIGTPTTEQNTGNGIHLWKCSDALIEKNEISGHRDGIYFEFVTGSMIRNNYSHENIRYGIHFMFSHNDRYLGNIFRNNGAGVAVMYSHNVHMEDNLFDKNWGSAAYGILLKEISDSRIVRNKFLMNTVGIMMEGTNRINVEQNIFQENGWAMKVQASCNANQIFHNNFYGNSFDIATNGTMMLNRFYENYWDRYDGYDMKKDGTGDVPYHPVSMYAMIVEQNPNALILMRSLMVSLLDKAEKAIPSLTPADLVDENPRMNPWKQ